MVDIQSLIEFCQFEIAFILCILFCFTLMINDDEITESINLSFSTYTTSSFICFYDGIHGLWRKKGEVEGREGRNGDENGHWIVFMICIFLAG